MAGYVIKGLSGGSSVQSVATIYAPASATQRYAITSCAFGFTTVASAAFNWVLQNTTTAPTGTTQTPTADDPADAASTALAKDAVTVDGTATAGAYRMYWPFYQNNSGRWVAENDRQRKIIPVTNNAGVLLGLSAATTTVGAGSIAFEQL